jgi:hypothetical protein
MSIDLTGGLTEEHEQVLAGQPDDPEMRDSVSFWVVDDQGELGMPRIGIEAVAANWGAHDFHGQLAFPDGRIVRMRQTGATQSPFDAQGRPMILGAGPLAFQCVEPFATWTMRYDGTANENTTAGLIAGQPDGAEVPLSIEVVATMAVPPWIQGSLLPDAADLLESSVEKDFMGGPRYEQLFRCEGSITLDGHERSFSGSGLRIRRTGVRRIEGFWGHCWQSAVFPSGKGFGYIAYPPREDGTLSYNEGYLFTGDGGLIPARAVEAPWLRKLVPNGEDVSVVIESALGTTRIEGETYASNFDTHMAEMPDFPPLQQASVRYRWDGEETYGMLERSSLRHLVELPAS